MRNPWDLEERDLDDFGKGTSRGFPHRVRSAIGVSNLLLKRSNFLSLDDLRDQTLAFIVYYTRTMAKPIKWTYTGIASSWVDLHLSVLAGTSCRYRARLGLLP